MSNAADSFFKGKELLLLEDDLLLRKHLQAKLENMEVEVTPAKLRGSPRALASTLICFVRSNLPDGRVWICCQTLVPAT